MAGNVPRVGRAFRAVHAARTVVIKEPSQTWPTQNPFSVATHRRQRVDQLIPQTLMIALSMVVLDEFADGLSQVALAEQNYTVEAIALDRPPNCPTTGIDHSVQPSFRF